MRSRTLGLFVAFCSLTAPTPVLAIPAPTLEQALLTQARGLNPRVLELALEAASCAQAKGVAQRPLLTVIDYSKPSTEERLWVFDLDRRQLLFQELVAHGKGSGENYAVHFSNGEGTLASSLGLFLTAGTYEGKNGYSMKLVGLEPGVNDQALQRTIVMHGAPYVNAEFAREHGRLGRSWGCPALAPSVAPRVIDAIKDGSLVFSYFPQNDWLASSNFLGACQGGGRAAVAAGG